MERRWKAKERLCLTGLLNPQHWSDAPVHWALPTFAHIGSFTVDFANIGNGQPWQREKKTSDLR